MFKEDTILLDLDGTLLPIDMDYFLKIYFKSLTEEFSDLEEKEVFIKILMSATEKMIKNTGEKTNEEVFKDAFFSMLEVDNQERVMERFDEFYDNKYPELKNKLDLKTNSPELIKLFKKANKKLVLATNPLFPKKAIIERLKWTGIDPADFDYITCYEEMHHAKPNPEFYREISNKVGFNPENAVMVGNDLKEDVIAKETGMKAYLVTDFITNEDSSLKPDWEGSITDLIEIVRNELIT